MDIKELITEQQYKELRIQYEQLFKDTKITFEEFIMNTYFIKFV